MRKLFTVLVLFTTTFPLMAQDDLLASLEEEQEERNSLVEATFKGTRLINGHSIETRKKGIMDFIISHRFGTIDGGAYELYGLDNATIRLGLEYALTDRFYFGIGRSSFEKTFDGFVKYRILRQSTGAGAIPLSVTWFSSISLKSLKNPDLDLRTVDRLANTHQLLIASKVTSSISLQLMPTWVHKNLIEEDDKNNDAFAIGVGGRLKLSQRVALCAEYYYQIQQITEGTFNSVAVGFDIETGGHVFQLQFTNSTAMIPKGFVSEVENDFFDGEIHFGFNISRTFQIN